MNTASLNQILEAICVGNTEMVEVLINSGVDCNSASPTYDYEREWSPLIMAIVCDHPETVQILIRAGADCTCFYDLDSCPESLLTPAIEAKLYTLNVSCTSLYTAVGFGNPQIVQMLLDAGAIVDNGDGSETPLNLAVSQQNLAMIQQLLDAGSDVNTDMEDRARVVMTATRIGDLEIVNILVDAGAELDGWSQGESALSLAAQSGHEDVYNYLLPLVSEEHREYATHEMLTKGVRRKKCKSQTEG